MPTLSEIIHATIVEIIVAVIIAMSVAFWARVKDKLAWSTVTVYVLVSIACVVFIFDRLSRRTTSNPTAPEQKHEEKVTEQNIESKAREWLDAFHLGVTKIASVPEFYWGFQVMLNNGIPITIVRSKEHQHYLTFIGKVEIVPEHKALFDKLSANQKLYFIERLRIEIARAKIICAFDPPGMLNFVQIEKRIPITDTLTEAQLIEGIGEINYAIILVRDTIGLLLNHEINQPSPTPSMEASPH